MTTNIICTLDLYLILLNATAVAWALVSAPWLAVSRKNHGGVCLVQLATLGVILGVWFPRFLGSVHRESLEAVLTTTFFLYFPLAGLMAFVGCLLAAAMTGSLDSEEDAVV